MLSKIVKVLMITLLVVFIGWLGIWAYSCIVKPGEKTETPKIQNEQKAEYSFTVKNTGTIYYSTANFQQVGAIEGQRVFVLKEFWQISGNKFVYFNAPVVLDEKIFGSILVEKRAK